MSVTAPVARAVPCAVLPAYTTSLDLNQGLRNSDARCHPGLLPLKAAGVPVAGARLEVFEISEFRGGLGNGSGLEPPTSRSQPGALPFELPLRKWFREVSETFAPEIFFVKIGGWRFAAFSVCTVPYRPTLRTSRCARIGVTKPMTGLT